MADRALARYIPLACGHSVDADTEILFRVFGDGTQVMCERCGEFRERVAKEGKRIYPDQPMF